MNKRQYMQLWKYMAVIVQLVLTVILALSVCLLDVLNDRNVLNAGDLFHVNFEESDSYHQLFLEKTSELLWFLQLRGRFETNGRYDPDKIVDILHYSGERSAPAHTAAENLFGKDEKDLSLLEYRLGDLISWSQTMETDENGKLIESYFPAYGAGIEESLSDGTITQEQADSLYLALERTISSVGKDAQRYKKGLNKFQTEETNLYYSLKENGSVWYTNLKEMPNDVLEYARNQGIYFYYDDLNLKLRTNVSGMEDYFYQSLDRQISRLGSRLELMVAVDNRFEQEDAFLRAKEEYDSLHPWGMVSIVSLIVSLFDEVLLMVYLTVAAGRREEDESIHLNLFDRIKTELLLALFAFLVYALLLVTFNDPIGEMGLPEILVAVGIRTFVYDGLALIFYLSIVRRIKAGVLWEHSLLRWFMKSINRVWRAGRGFLWILIRYSVKLSLLLVLTYGTFADRNVCAMAGLLLYIGIEAVFYLREMVGQREIMRGIEQITKGNLSYKLPLDNLHGENQELARSVNRIGEGIRLAVDESTKNERMKADLITNVSHDIKTPLTSIINYVNLLKMQPIEDEQTKDYIHILDEKSQRLKQLTDDLVEASQISSGNISLSVTEINFVELINQACGEFAERFKEKNLTTICRMPEEPVHILADGSRIWRVLENLYNNVAKYAMQHTRVYVTVMKQQDMVVFSMKNISEQALAVEPSELTSRFGRGDVSRTTEGNGLGLSIAQDLTILMGGKFHVETDGDLFTVKITFPLTRDT